MKLDRLNTAAVRSTGATQVARLSNSRMKGVIGGAGEYLLDPSSVYVQRTRSGGSSYIVGIYNR